MTTVLQWFNFSGVTVYYQLTNIVYKADFGIGLSNSTDVASIAPATSEDGQAVDVSSGIQSADILFYKDSKTASKLVLQLNTITSGTRFQPVYLLCNPSISYPDADTINASIYSAGKNQTGNYIVFDGSYMDASDYNFPKNTFVVGLPTMTQTTLSGLNQTDNVFDQGWSWWVWALIIGGVILLLLIIVAVVFYFIRKSKKDSNTVVKKEKQVQYD